VVDGLKIFDLIDCPYGELSDGEKQKILIAKALVQKAPVMLLDEPTAFLDFPTKAELFVLLKELAKNHKLAVVISTHDIEMALKMADKIWLLTHDDVVKKGVPEDLVLDGQIDNIFKSKDIRFNVFEWTFRKNIKRLKSGYHRRTMQRIVVARKSIFEKQHWHRRQCSHKNKLQQSIYHKCKRQRKC
jgi:ABC-type cobalamin/Fe3+-siderophores transport system ATPase subunit